MALKSMTGFATSKGCFETASQTLSWTFEVKTVNSKSLHARFCLPARFSTLEPKLRSHITNLVGRGCMQTVLQVQERSNHNQLSLNETLLSAALSTSHWLTKEHGLAPITFEGLININGMLDQMCAELTRDEREKLDAALLSDFLKVVEALNTVRVAEGEALHKIVSAILDEIQDLVRRADQAPEREADAIAARLHKQISDLLAVDQTFNKERLYQEALIMAVKADIREEIDRLFAHVEAARVLLCDEKPSGRRLDFLAQELGREANTLCSKANHIALVNIGLALKASIDQFREQVQNVE